MELDEHGLAYTGCISSLSFVYKQQLCVYCRMMCTRQPRSSKSVRRSRISLNITHACDANLCNVICSRLFALHTIFPSSVGVYGQSALFFRSQQCKISVDDTRLTRVDVGLFDILPSFSLLLVIGPEALISVSNHLLKVELVLCSVAGHELWFA